MATRLGIRTSLHKLRHYSATELIAAGLDICTVASRLGHSGGGTTILRTYAAWVSESNQRAVQTLVILLPPQRRGPPPPPRQQGLLPAPEAPDPQYPYEILAAQLRVAIEDETYAPGSFVPGVKMLAKATRDRCQHGASGGEAARGVGPRSPRAWSRIPGNGTVGASRCADANAIDIHSNHRRERAIVRVAP